MLLRRLLLAGDVVALSVAFGVAVGVVRGGAAGDVGPGTATIVLAAIVALWLVAARIYGLYDRESERPDQGSVEEFVAVFHAVTVGTWAVVAGWYVIGVGDVGLATPVVFWALAVALVTVTRSVARLIARRRGAHIQNTAIVGAGDVGQLIGRKLLQHPEYGLRLLGFLDAQPRRRRRDLADVPLLGRPDEAGEIVDRFDIDRIVIAFSNDRHDQLLDIVRALRERDVRIDIVPRLFEAVGPEFDVRTIEGVPLVELPRARLSRSSLVLKRLVDVACAATTLVLAAPLFALVTLLIKRDSPGPVFFRQTRLGTGMREFTMLKFRTMSVGADDGAHRAYIREIMDTKAAPQSNRLYKLDRQEVVTRVGAWLRRTSLDELPQLINVLRGEMSLVGPRPCIPYEIEFFEPHHFERFLLPAGCTGLWQVTARAHSTFREALDLDVAYVRSWSLGLDFRLLARTPLVLLRRTGTT